MVLFSAAMHWATVEGKMDVVDLLAASGTDVGQKTTDGLTASALIAAEMCAGFRYSQVLAPMSCYTCQYDAWAMP